MTKIVFKIHAVECFQGLKNTVLNQPAAPGITNEFRDLAGLHFQVGEPFTEQFRTPGFGSPFTLQNRAVKIIMTAIQPLARKQSIT